MVSCAHATPWRVEHNSPLNDRRGASRESVERDVPCGEHPGLEPGPACQSGGVVTTPGLGRGVLVVENDPMTRGLLADLLEKVGFDVCTAASASDARRVCNVADPDGVVLDVDLGPGPTGFDVADALLAARPHLAVVFLTNLPDARFAGRDPASLPTGVAYLRKERLAEPGALVEALDATLRGVTDERYRHDRDPGRPLAGLSRTQISVLRLVALGMTNQQIAEARGTTVRAVHSVITRALAAIGVEQAEEGSARVVAARSFMLASGIPLTENA